MQLYIHGRSKILSSCYDNYYTTSLKEIEHTLTLIQFGLHSVPEVLV